MNTQLLETVARWLDQPASDAPGFDMGHAIHVGECGTTCCIAGYVAMLVRPEIVHDLTIRCHMSDPNEVSWAHVRRSAVAALGIDEGTSADLFYAEPKDRHHAARCIRKLIRTGIVDWDGTRAVESEVPVAELDAMHAAFKAVFEPA